jgi:hypothetical protein
MGKGFVLSFLPLYRSCDGPSVIAKIQMAPQVFVKLKKKICKLAHGLDLSNERIHDFACNVR